MSDPTTPTRSDVRNVLLSACGWLEERYPGTHWVPAGPRRPGDPDVPRVSLFRPDDEPETDSP